MTNQKKLNLQTLKAIHHFIFQVLVSDTKNDQQFSFISLVPELYKVPREKVEMERQKHGSQDRVPGGTMSVYSL
jgi:hypothetical protein